MNHRWLGGTLTNWKTVSQSIQRLKQLDELMAHGAEGLTKKERLNMEREQAKLQASLGGIREMGGTPDLIFIIDVGKEDLPCSKPTSWASRSWRRRHQLLAQGRGLRDPRQR
jgi:small subunit ribosomal protein S2